LPTWSASFSTRWFSRRRCREDSRPARCGEGRSEVELEPPPSRWECGNRAPWFWARFPSAVGRVEKSGLPSPPLGVVGGTFPRFPRRVISTATSHNPFSRRSAAGHREIRRRFLGALLLVENLPPVR